MHFMLFEILIFAASIIVPGSRQPTPPRLIGRIIVFHAGPLFFPSCMKVTISLFIFLFMLSVTPFTSALNLVFENISVFANETRPFLQGSRLTAWELKEDNIPVTLITDNMCGYFMQNKRIDLVVVGADRIAANGDVANKIGTYMAAVLARENNIPFYVAAPISTLDLSAAEGKDIPIEERSGDEVLTISGKRIAPEGVEAAHPAFDITPNRLITAIVTEKGIVRSPYTENLKQLLQS